MFFLKLPKTAASISDSSEENPQRDTHIKSKRGEG